MKGSEDLNKRRVNAEIDMSFKNVDCDLLLVHKI